MNNVNLIGRLTADPELRQTQNGTMTTSFSLAIDRFGKDGAKAADFPVCVAWNKTAEIISKHCSKGTKLAITGELRTRTYEDKNKSKHYITEVFVSRAEFCERKQQGAEQAGQPQTVPAQQAAAEYDLSDFEEVASSDLPF